MADLKPLGSEKLQGDEKIKRILELTYYNSNGQDSNKSVDAEYIAESINGVYGITKEKDGYYVKKGLTENTLDYIGGMFMKNKNRFSSYADALKRLELLRGQETLLQEEKRYVLKVNKSTPAASADEAIPPSPVQPEMGAGVPSPELPPEESPEMDSELPPDESGIETPEDELGGEEDFGSDYLKGIQKLTGKLGEKLRDHQEEMESDDIKYVINSVLSALNLEKLEDSDIDDIVSQLEDDEDFEDDEFGGEELPTDEIPGEEIPAEEPESDLGEMDGLNQLINTSFDFNDDEEKPYEDINELDSESDEEPEIADIENSDDNDEGEICMGCRGTGVKNGKECPTCNGEGVVYNTNNDEGNLDLSLANKKHITVDDLYDDDDEGYDPIEMGEDSELDDYTELENEEDYTDNETLSKEIELTELTDLINKTVKETLGKYFE